ncbi:hypothetical protein OHA59_48055 [Streptomyces sp. NBC_01589]|uniref:hypothetical protein n=1 Tax=Streptomyces sp. NBC_01589 TaxID=2975886 RepID=UPI00386C2648
MRHGQQAPAGTGDQVREPCTDQVVRRRFVQRLQLVFGQDTAVVQALRTGTRCGEKAHADAGCPARDETQYGRTCPVEPGQVVDDEQKRVTGCDRAQQEQDGVGDHEPFRR